jgi:hypothetical protein
MQQVPLIINAVKQGLQKLPGKEKLIKALLAGVAQQSAISIPGGAYEGSRRYGSQRDPLFPNAPSGLEDTVNATGFTPSPWSLPFLPLNPLVQELWNPQTRTARYEKNKYYADEFAKNVNDYTQSEKDWGSLQESALREHQSTIQQIAELKRLGATTAQINALMKTGVNKTTPGDVLRGSYNNMSQFPASLRPNAVVPNNQVLIRNAQQP